LSSANNAPSFIPKHAEFLTTDQALVISQRKSSQAGYRMHFPSSLFFVQAWILASTVLLGTAAATDANSRAIEQARYRGPIDAIVLSNGTLCVIANELSDTISLIDLSRSAVVDEVACGQRPTSIAKINSEEFLVACRDSGIVERIKIVDGRLNRVATIKVGLEPMGTVIHPLGKRAFVGLVATGQVAELNLESNTVTKFFSSGDWPRTLAISPDGSRLAVGLSGASAIAVHDTTSGELLYDEPLSGGINIGQMQCSADGKQVYFPWMIYRTNPISQSNIQRGWVLASRIGRVRLDGPSYREAISLDVPRLAVADPYGLSITTDESRMIVSSAGTHELLVYRLQDLPFVGTGGPGDLIDRRLLDDSDLFYRIEVGGRPMAVRDLGNNQVLVCNYTLDAIQIVDFRERKLVQSISLGRQPQELDAQLVHRGMEIFFDAERSLDQWYSCHSCHLDGGSNAKAMDTWNDGTELTTKTVLPLTGVTNTGPWTWHGWQQDLNESIQNSFTSTMMGKAGSAEDVEAVRVYLESLTPRPNPFRTEANALTASAARGKVLFESSEVGCSSCHSGQQFTDGEIHDVGLGSAGDKYDGYNTPSLIGLYQKVRYLHDGRSKTLESVLSKYHRSEDIGGGHVLTEGERGDLIEYLKTL
jgi:mono/diheme cytochrome c family protein